MKICEIITKIQEIFPENIMEQYDNTGIQVLFHDDDIKNIYICLDADKNTLHDATENGCNFIISHHPLIFKPIKKIISHEAKSCVIMDMISSRISMYSIHTNFDRIMYRALADYLGFSDSRPLLRTMENNNYVTAFGSYIKTNSPISLSDLLSEIKIKLNTDFLIYSGDERSFIGSIAFLNGSGGGSLEQIIDLISPDCIITGDVNYHHVKYAVDSGVSVIDAGHFATEIIFKKMLAESVKNVLNDELINIIISGVEKNPFKVYK